MMLKHSRHELRLGDMPLRKVIDSDRVAQALTGIDFGNSDPIVAVVDTLLRDGDEEQITRFGNRQIRIPVVIEAATSIELAEIEEAMRAELDRPNTLTWIPPDGLGEPSVFEIVTSWADFQFSDDDEMRIRRHFILTLRALPFVRAEHETVVELPVLPGSTTDPNIEVLYTIGEAGWEGGPQLGNIYIDGQGYRPIAYQDGTGSWYQNRTSTLWLRWSRTPTPRAGFNYIAVDWGRTGGTSSPASRFLKVIVDGVTVTLEEASLQALGGSETRSWYAIPDGAVEIGTMLYQIDVFGKAAARAELSIPKIALYDTLPGIGTVRQTLRSLVIEGSARTQGSLEIANGNDGCGTVHAYTFRDENSSGYSPSLRQWRNHDVGAAETIDPTTVSGATSPLGIYTETYDIPATSLPDGPYSLMARLKSDAAEWVTVTWTASTLLGTEVLAEERGEALLELGLDWEHYEIARLTLPTTKLSVANQDAYVRITLLASGGVLIDEGWVFNTRIGSLTWAECGDGTPATGGASSYLWIDSPSLGSTVPTYWVGSQPNKGDARHMTGADRKSEMPHEFEPGPLSLLLVTTGSVTTPAVATVRYHRRGHSHVS